MAIKKIELSVMADISASIRFLTSMGFTNLKLKTNKDDFVSFEFGDYNEYLLNTNFGPSKTVGGKLVWSWPGNGVLVIRPNGLVVLRNKPSKVKVKVSEKVTKPVVPTNVADTHVSLSLKDRFQQTQANRKFKAFVHFAWDHYNKTKFDGVMPPPTFVIHRDSDHVTVLGRWFPTARHLEIHPRVLLSPFELFNEVMLHEMCHQAVTDIEKIAAEKENNGHGPVWAKWMTSVGLKPSAYVSVKDIDFTHLKVLDELRKDEIQKTAPKVIPTNRYLRLPVICKADVFGTLRPGAIVEVVGGKLYFVDGDPNAELPLTIVKASQVFEFEGTVEERRRLIPNKDRVDQLFRERDWAYVREKNKIRF